MKSYEIVSYLLAFNTIIAYLYTKNIMILGIGIGASIAIFIGFRIIFEKFAE